MKKVTPTSGQNRVVIDRIDPRVNDGAFPIKRVIGESVHVDADIIADGHDIIRAVLRYREAGRRTWRETALVDQGNDRWTGKFAVDAIGYWEYSIRAWIDHALTWRAGLRKKHDAGVVNETDMAIGAALVDATAQRASGPARDDLATRAATLRDTRLDMDKRVGVALHADTAELLDRYPDLKYATDLDTPLSVWVDRKRAEFSAWYELFPRSAGPAGVHGTLRDVIERVPSIARMGFDILYLPPIHPVGRINRKGRNNSTSAGPEDPGSPWAIGSSEGGHTAILPELGTTGDFLELLACVESYQMELALDIAFQCAPDHPWVEEHPDWFVRRPDGSIQFAENPPKKYEDIYPINFESDDWEALWQALAAVFFYWIDLGVKVFRVDNPHTKSFRFWDWLIETVHDRFPEVIFLAEAFTRPKRMYRLAKGGFTQSYTYFTWRNSPEEFRQYLTDLTEGPPREFFRPNFWPNTPDILHEDLQTGGRAAFVARLVLAATLSGNYGIYGPAYELLENRPVRPGSEEYLNSEKYEIRDWDLDAPRSIAPIIARVNDIRRKNGALHDNRHLRFHATDNPQLLCYSKSDLSGDNVIFVCVNMDYQRVQEGSVEFSPAAVGRGGRSSFVVRDLLSGHSWTWKNFWNYIRLDPAELPAHVFVLEQ